MKVLVFGNPFLENDSLPLRLLPKLRERFSDVEFKEIDPTEGLESEGRDLVILDSVEGIGAPKGVPPAQMASAGADKVGKVVEIDSIERLHANRVCSMHDFDLAYNLKLLKKVGKIDSVRIIGVPMGISMDDAMRGIGELLGKVFK